MKKINLLVSSFWLVQLLGCSSSQPKKAAAPTLNPTIQKQNVDITNLLATARLRPWTKKGAGSGFEIDHIEKKSGWANLGVKDGDIFLTVDGDELGDSSNVSRLVEAVSDPASHKIQLLRKRAGSAAYRKLKLPIEDPE